MYTRPLSTTGLVLLFSLAYLRPAAARAPTDPSAPAGAPAPGSPADVARSSASGASPLPDAAHEPTPIRKVTFAQAIGAALAENPDLATALEEIRRSDALVEQARSYALPTLYGNVTYTRLDSARRLGANTLQPQDLIYANLQLTIPIVAAQRWVKTAQAKDAVHVAETSAAAIRQSLALAVGRAYLTIIAQHRVLDVAITARDSAFAHEQFAKARYVGGIGNRLDEVRASQETAANAAQVENARVALLRAEEALGILLAVEGPCDAADEPVFSKVPSEADALEDAATKRRDVIAAGVRERAAERVVKQSWADYAPILSLVAQPFFATTPTPTVPQTGWQAQLLLVLPIYDGGLRYGQKKERDALAREAVIQVQATLRQARSEVRAAAEAMIHADLALTSARDAERLAQSAVSLTNKAYAAGATTNIEVVDAERQARDAGLTAAIAEDGARQARLELLVASGRFP